MKSIVVFITAPGEEEAAGIAKALVEEKLAACVNIIRGIRSIYRWEGRVEDEPEALMVVKSREGLFEKLSGRVRELHPYSVPEVIAVPITRGLKEYVDWIGEATLET
jgi:periplasmic divalent cation tolerance protein